MKIISIIVGILASALVQAAPEESFKGFVQLQNGRKLYTRVWNAPNANETLILLHGMTYDTTDWEQMVPHLVGQGRNVVVYDMVGMGKTLEEMGPQETRIPLQMQVDDLAQLIPALNLPGRTHIAGLSYGGGLAVAFAAQHPQMVDQVIAMAPFVAALPAQDQQLTQQVKMKCYWTDRNPNSPMADRRCLTPEGRDEIYDEALWQIVKTQYPIYEPSIKRHPYRLKATWELARGIRKFVATSVSAQLPQKSFHLIEAKNDQYVPKAQLDSLWSSVPEAAQMSRAIVLQSEHKLPQAQPAITAKWINHLLSGADVREKRNYTVDPATGKARAADGTSVSL